MVSLSELIVGGIVFVLCGNLRVQHSYAAIFNVVADLKLIDDVPDRVVSVPVLGDQPPPALDRIEVDLQQLQRDKQRVRVLLPFRALRQFFEQRIEFRG